MRVRISSEPNRMKRICLGHWFTNESLMEIIFAASNCSQTHYLLQISALGGFGTFRMNKKRGCYRYITGLLSSNAQ